MHEEIKNIIEKSIKELQEKKVLPEFYIPKIQIEHPEEKIHGDYATNVIMLITKIINKNPLKIGEILKFQILKFKNDFFEKVEIAPPGFVNFFLSKNFLLNEIKKVLKEKEKYGASNIGKGKTVVIDYSSPNIAKPFGIGHLRSTIIGQALYNIYKFLGFKCISDNHLGDWGTQFGKLIVAIKRWGNKKKLKSLSINDLEKLYVKFHQEVEKDSKLEKEGRIWFKKIEENDREAKKIWQTCVDISLQEFDKVYKLLGIKFDYILGESFYEKILKEIINEAIKKKITIESEGAMIIKYPRNELPAAIILKSDGATTYLTRDLATVKYRLKKWKPDIIIYEAGVDQELYFKQLFKTIELFGWVKKEKFFHVAHGLYRTKTGKFSTRRGETVYLEEVLREAILKAKEIIEKSETCRGLLEKEKEKVAKIVGIGAIKYNDLSQRHNKDIVFDWEKILNLKGNACPYLQYTYARCKSVFKKAKIRIDPKKIKLIDFNLEEENVLKTICKFPEVVQESAEKFSPNLISNFIFDLAQKYNLFYDHYPIIKTKTLELKNFRLALTFATIQVLKNALNLMGISVPERM